MTAYRILFSAGLFFVLPAAAQTVPALINYQGRLTAQSGAPLPVGNYGIDFSLWDSLKSQTGLIWGQRQNVIVQANGVFNVILGAPGGSAIPGAMPAVNDLAFAFTAPNRFLGLTIVSSNGVAIPGTSEIAPRQQLLSAPFAINASHAAVANTVVPGSITTTNLAEGSITLSKLAPRMTNTTVGVGGMAVSGSSGDYSVSTTEADVTNLTVTITTTGRPIFIGLFPDGTAHGYLYSRDGGSSSAMYLTVIRGSETIGQTMFFKESGSGPVEIRVPASSISLIDFPDARTNTYKLRARIGSNDSSGLISNCRLIAFEL